MNLSYLVYHNIFATVVGDLVTFGLENHFLDINVVVTSYAKYRDQDVHNGYKNLDLMFCMLLQALL